MEGLGNERFVDPFDLPEKKRERVWFEEVEVIEITPDRFICWLEISHDCRLKVGIERKRLDITALKGEIVVGTRFLWEARTNTAKPAPPKVPISEVARELARSFEETRKKLQDLWEKHGFTTDNE